MATLVGVKKLVLRMALLKVTNDSRIWASCLFNTVFLMCARSSSLVRTVPVFRRAYESVGLCGLQGQRSGPKQKFGRRQLT
jgi:hypothetical protein